MVLAGCAALSSVAGPQVLTSRAANFASTLPSTAQRPTSAKALQRLTAAYPGQLKASGSNAITFTNGVTIPIDRQRTPASFDDRLANADLIDQLSIPYTAGCPVTEPVLNDDPGRLRDEAFFTNMYGRSAKAVSAKLRNVDWFGQNLPMTTVNGVNEKLAAVAQELSGRSDAKTLRKFLSPSAGSFVWRVIAGTKLHSAHSFGIAIDINTSYSDYWRWDGATKTPDYRNRIPCEIAAVFERHGFIWGAKWYHYDTMHFEYRPELLG